MLLHIDLRCPDCHSQAILRHGYNLHGAPRFRCRPCGRSFLRSQDKRRPGEQFKEQVLAAYQERASMRGIARTFKISRNTLTKWLREKGGSCPT